MSAAMVPIETVFATDELSRRYAPIRNQLHHEGRTKKLARKLVTDPRGVLVDLVDIGMEVCGAVSGGYSIFEPEPAPGVFRWHHLRGELEKFSGATTPRNYSPCGITMDDCRATLVQRPERAYSWLIDAGVSLPEVLLVPLYIGEKQPVGTLWLVSAMEGHFTSTHSEALDELASFAGIALKLGALKGFGDTLVQA